MRLQFEPERDAIAEGAEGFVMLQEHTAGAQSVKASPFLASAHFLAPFFALLP
jgi:hypothetical protein